MFEPRQPGFRWGGREFASRTSPFLGGHAHNQEITQTLSSVCTPDQSHLKVRRVTFPAALVSDLKRFDGRKPGTVRILRGPMDENTERSQLSEFRWLRTENCHRAQGSDGRKPRALIVFMGLMAENIDPAHPHLRTEGARNTAPAYLRTLTW